MDGRHRGHERRRRPPEEGHEGLGEDAADRPHVEARADAAQGEREESAGEERGGDEERDAEELALETGTTHGGYRSRSGPSLVIRRSW